MSTNAFQGISGPNTRTARWTEVKYAGPGGAIGHATESGDIGLREDFTLAFKPNSTKSHDARNHIESYDVTATGKGLNTSMAALLNAYLLSKTVHQCRFKNANGEYYSFVDNGGTMATPTGSCKLGLTWKFRIDDKQRSLEYKWTGLLSDTEYEWIFTNVAVATTGSSAGSALGLTASAYAPDQHIRGNFRSITVNGVNVGLFKDPSFELESTGQPDHLKRLVGDKIKVKVEFTMRQAKKEDALAGSSANSNDWDLVLTTWNDETIEITGPLITSEFQGSDKEFYIKCLSEAEVPYNAVEATPNSIDIGVTDPATLTITVV
jgi:hypothetical protein